MSQVEYKVISIKNGLRPDEAVKVLNALGKDGWIPVFDAQKLNFVSYPEWKDVERIFYRIIKGVNNE